MSFAEIQATIEQHFTNEWAARTPVAYENVAFDPPTVGGYARISVLWSPSENAALGTLVRDYGFASVQVFTPINDGPMPALELADAAREIFQNKTIEGLTFYAASVSVVGVSESFHQVNVTAPFFNH